MDLAGCLSALAAGVDGEDAPFYQTFSDIKAIIYAAEPVVGATHFLDVLDPVSTPPASRHAATRQGCLDTCVALVALKLGREPAAGEKRAILAAVCVTLEATGKVPEGVSINELLMSA
jgi:hypothetical protein